MIESCAVTFFRISHRTFEDGYQSLVPDDGVGLLGCETEPGEEPASFSLNCGRRSFSDVWKPQTMRWSEVRFNAPSDPHIKADFPRTTGYLAVRSAARQIVEYLCGAYGEWLPIRSSDDEEMWIYNVLDRVDCLDSNRSQGQLFSSGDRYITLREIVFREDAATDVPVFRIPQYPIALFCGDAFHDLVVNSGLTGLAFSTVAT